MENKEYPEASMNFGIVSENFIIAKFSYLVDAEYLQKKLLDCSIIGLTIFGQKFLEKRIIEGDD